MSQSKARLFREQVVTLDSCSKPQCNEVTCNKKDHIAHPDILGPTLTAHSQILFCLQSLGYCIYRQLIPIVSQALSWH